MTTLAQAASVAADLAPILEDVPGVIVHVHTGVVTIEMPRHDDTITPIAMLWDHLGQPTHHPSGFMVSSREGVAVVAYRAGLHDVEVLP